jgi:cyclic beta-1,2-glucan synthetase
VLANPHFGAIQTEAGGGFTWAGNSRLHQLTGWSNDPVADTPSEWFFWQDRKTQQAWSLSPNAWGDPAAQYEVTQGQGYTRIRHQRGPLDTSITWCVDPRSAIKQIHIHVTNTGPRSQQLRAIGMVEWIMGAGRSQRSTTRCAHQTLPLPDHLPDTYPSQAYLALVMCTQNAQEGGFGNATAFLSLLRSGQSLSRRDWTCDRREFFNPQGQLSLPEALGCSAGYGLDPCGAMTERVDLEPGQSRDLVFLLGHAASPELALQLAQQAAVQTPQHRLAQVSDHWDQLLQASTVRSPDPLFDILVNRWLLYQTLSCRLWAKAGFYQAGGATGYRDQLQDAMAFAWAEPARLRAQIVLCASRQYPQGDVQHWWHQPQGMGVRTHISDDLLWLVHACLHYLDATNDTGLLDQNVPFLEGPAVPDGAQDIYSTPSTSTQQASVYEHAALAIEHSLPTGAHGLPLMGSGDWNDGMNRVGHLGRGESVWLGFFLCSTIDRFAPVARQRGQADRASRWEAAAQQCKNALVEHGWDGQWFKRAYFDNGQPLGSHHNAECRIDLIAQAWAVLSQAVPADLQRQALDAIDNHLVDPDAGLLRLLTPAFAHSDPSPGYIQSYPQGVRENAGQYAHAGVWALMAQARAHANGLPRSANAPHRGDLAYQYFCHLSPAHRAQHPRYAAAYGLEPYAMAADVYSEPPYTGQGGWSWYTGSAGLMHRAALESIFGLEQRASTLTFRPCLPQHWTEAELTLVRAGQRLHFTIVRIPQGAAAPSQARWNATLLAPGTPLLWNDLPSESHFVIALCEDEAGQTKA